MRFTRSCSISSAVEMTREFAWNPRCAVIMVVNWVARSTFDISSMPATVWPKPVVFGVPFTDILPALPLPAEAQDALLRRAGPIGALLQAIESQVNSGKVTPDGASQALDLAEAYAWLTRPDQSHGKSA